MFQRSITIHHSTILNYKQYCFHLLSLHSQHDVLQIVGQRKYWDRTISCDIIFMPDFFEMGQLTQKLNGTHTRARTNITVTSYGYFPPLRKENRLEHGTIATSNIYLKKTNKLHGLSPRANYTDRATAACRRSDCQLLRIKGAT
jgi:hypothetical protein